MDIKELLGTPLLVTKTGTGRTYIDIAKHAQTGVALKCNIALHGAKITDPVLGFANGYAVVLRFAEALSPAAPSFKLSVRPGDQAQNEADTVSLYRYFPHAWPVALLGPYSFMIERWNDQHVTPFLREYIKTTVKQAGGVLIVDDAAIESMLTSWQDEHPSADPDFFTQAFGIPPDTTAA